MSCSKKAENISKLLHEISIISDYIDLVLASRATREKNVDGSFLFRRFTNSVKELEPHPSPFPQAGEEVLYGGRLSTSAKFYELRVVALTQSSGIFQKVTILASRCQSTFSFARLKSYFQSSLANTVRISSQERLWKILLIVKHPLVMGGAGSETHFIPMHPRLPRLKG